MRKIPTQKMIEELCAARRMLIDAGQKVQKVLDWISDPHPLIHELLPVLQARRKVMIEEKASLQVSAGFIAEDIEAVYPEYEMNTVSLKMTGERASRTWWIKDLNRRELDELIKKCEELCLPISTS